VTAIEKQPGFAEWVILELLGHRRLAGWLTEQQIAGASFLRLDIPASSDQPLVTTQLYAPGSVYAITPTTEAIARGVAARAMPAPVQRWELPAAPQIEEERQCRVCLCTDADACEGGCSWTAPELCSVCAPLGECQACPRPATKTVGEVRLCDVDDGQHDIAAEAHPAQVGAGNETGPF
jgi:hypothetical protein